MVSYHYVQPDGELYFLFNENPSETIRTELRLRSHLKPLSYDGFANELSEVPYERTEDMMIFSLALGPYESKVIALRGDWSGYPVKQGWNGTISKIREMEGSWRISFAGALDYRGALDETGFTALGERSRLLPLSNEKEFRDRSGTLRYRKSFEWNIRSGNRVFLNLGQVYEIAEVFVNGASAGVRICPPYCVDITDLLRDGGNELVIEVTNTLGNENKEFMSQYTSMEPFGLIGPVVLEEFTGYVYNELDTEKDGER